MTALRGFLIAFANWIIVAVVVIGTLGGFFGGGFSNPFAGFSFLGAIFGALVGFLVSCASMSALAILLDMREILHRIELKGGGIR